MGTVELALLHRPARSARLDRAPLDAWMEGLRADSRASDVEATRETIASAYLDRYVASSDVSLEDIDRSEGFWAAILLLKEPLHAMRDRLRELASRV